MRMTEFEYSIVLEDTGLSFNINMHTFNCFAHTPEEAYGIMCFKRPDFAGRKLVSMKEFEHGGQFGLRTKNIVIPRHLLVDGWKDDEDLKDRVAPGSMDYELIRWTNISGDEDWE